MSLQNNITKLQAAFAAYPDKLQELNTVLLAAEKYLADTSIVIEEKERNHFYKYSGDKKVALPDSRLGKFSFDKERDYEIIREGIELTKADKEAEQTARKAQLDFRTNIPAKLNAISSAITEAKEQLVSALTKARKGTSDMEKLSENTASAKAAFEKLQAECNQAKTEIDKVGANFKALSAQYTAEMASVSARFKEIATKLNGDIAQASKNFTALSGQVTPAIKQVGQDLSSGSNNFAQVGTNYSSLSTKIGSEIDALCKNATADSAKIEISLTQVDASFKALADKAATAIKAATAKFNPACAQVKDGMNKVHEATIQKAVVANEQIQSDIEKVLVNLNNTNVENNKKIAEFAADVAITLFEYSPDLSYYMEVSTNLMALEALNANFVIEYERAKSAILMKSKQSPMSAKAEEALNSYNGILELKQDIDYKRATGNKEVMPKEREISYKLPYNTYPDLMVNFTQGRFSKIKADVAKGVYSNEDLAMDSGLVDQYLTEKLAAYCPSSSWFGGFFSRFKSADVVQFPSENALYCSFKDVLHVPTTDHGEL